MLRVCVPEASQLRVAFGRVAEFKKRFKSVGALSRFVSLLKLGLTSAGVKRLVLMTVLVVLQVAGEAWYMDLIEMMFRALFARNTGLFYKSSIVRLAVHTIKSYL